jgi:DNA polymerase III, epsilon subunit and related 3''-5'' exonucleases
MTDARRHPVPRSRPARPRPGLPSLVALAVCDNGQEPAEPVQIAVCPITPDGHAGEPVSWLVRPVAPVTALMTTRVHGITNAELRTAPPLAEVWTQVVEALGDRTVVVHNARRALRILTEVADHLAARPLLDSMRLAARLHMNAGGSYSLRPLLSAAGLDRHVAEVEAAEWLAHATATVFGHVVVHGPKVPFSVLASWCQPVLP